MFQLKAAKVHYGSSAYPLNGLPRRFDRIESVEALDLEDLADTVGRLTSFRREFTAKHIERQEFPGIKTRDGADLVIPEQVYASANGYSLVWERVEADGELEEAIAEGRGPHGFTPGDER